MFIVLLDEPGLQVYESAHAAERDLESTIVSESLRAAFDERGVPYAVEWPNGPPIPVRFLGLTAVEHERYHFAPAGPADVPAFIDFLAEHAPATYPDKVREQVTALLTRMRAGRDA